MPFANQKQALVLLSGGLDSTTVLHIAIEKGFRPHALSFEYGQRHVEELNSAKRIIARIPQAIHTVIRLDPGLFRGTALVGELIDVPRDRDIDEDIPVTYVPARNILFLSHALAIAESHDARDIFLGVNALDYSGYPDCRPEFLEAFERMAALGMKTGVEGDPVKLHAPLVEMTKADIIREGLRLKIDYAMTSSCYEPDARGKPCEHCDSCILRAKGFAEAGTPDPLLEKFRS